MAHETIGLARTFPLVVPPGNDPGYFALQANANPSQLENHGVLEYNLNEGAGKPPGLY